MGATGVEVRMTILAVWSDGFHIRQPAGRPALFVAWDKVDAAWLEAERPAIAALKAKAKAFPVLTDEQARAKLAEALKTFRAPKTFTYPVVESAKITGTETRTVPNAVAERYAAKMKSLTPASITQGLQQIVRDVERDAEILSASNGQADRLQLRWLTTSFVAFLGHMERVQRELDPVNAGEVTMPKIVTRSNDPFRPTTEDGWF